MIFVLISLRELAIERIDQCLMYSECSSIDAGRLNLQQLCTWTHSEFVCISYCDRIETSLWPHRLCQITSISKLLETCRSYRCRWDGLKMAIVERRLFILEINWNNRPPRISLLIKLNLWPNSSQRIQVHWISKKKKPFLLPNQQNFRKVKVQWHANGCHLFREITQIIEMRTIWSERTHNLLQFFMFTFRNSIFFNEFFSKSRSSFTHRTDRKFN